MLIDKLSFEHKAILDRLEKLAGQNLDPTLAAKTLGPVGTYLQESEQQLISLMNTQPPPAGGNVEFGLVLYWIHEFLPTWISNLFPATQITPAMLAQWRTKLATAGVVMNDGSLVGFGFFEALDGGWLFPFVLRLLQSIGKPVHLQVPVHPFGSNPYSGSIGQNSLKIALVGDWGSGSWNDNGTQGPAAQIMQQIQGLTPDILIHLGDVYYSGTGNLPGLVNLFMDVIVATLNAEYSKTVTYDLTEETDRLVNPWASAQQNFTLNSNHEMYSGANALFPALSAAPFAQQSSTSYFMLTFQDWVILGLDSAYFAPDMLYMDGRLQNTSNNSQVAWIQGLVKAGKLNNKKVIVMTHHNGLTYDGCPQAPGYQGGTNLYDDLSQALGRDPDYWYWGHIHNGIVYTKNVSLSPNKQTTTVCRCVGHGALPFGGAYQWLKNQSGQMQKYPLDQTPTGPNPKIAYYAHTPLQPQNQPLQGSWTNRVKNGFTMLTLTAGSIQEAVYEQGTAAPVWTSGT